MMHHCRVIAGADGVPYAMAIAAARGSSWSFLGRVFGHFFDLGCHRGRFEKGISIFWGFEKIAFLGVFWGFWGIGSRLGILEKVL